MCDETALSDLLLRWEEAQEQGHELPAEELTVGRPELLAELQRRIGALKALRWVNGPTTASSAGRYRSRMADCATRAESVPSLAAVTTGQSVSI